jgi:hypothetical protein
MGDVDLLPKTLEGSQDRLMPRQPYYLTDPWIGGTNSRPPAGWERGFDQRPTASNRYLEFVLWEMFYFKSDSDPNPSSTSEKGPSPLLSRASSFAGAWRGKFGDGGFELVLHQSGAQVTGQVNINSVIYVVREGRADGNTLRFKIVRPGRALPNAYLPDEVLGTGELAMDRGGKSFTGKILNADVTGTLIAR